MMSIIHRFEILVAILVTSENTWHWHNMVNNLLNNISTCIPENKIFLPHHSGRDAKVEELLGV